MKKCFINIKTTGLLPWKHGIFEIALMVEENDQIVDLMFSKFNPGEVSFDEEALIISQVTEKELTTSLPNDVAFKQVVNFLNKNKNKNEKFLLVCWNSYFTHQFFYQFFKRNLKEKEETEKENLNFNNYFFTPSLDVQQMANFLLIDFRENIENLKFETICNLFELPKLEKDTSLNNVKQLFLLYKKLTEK